MAERCWVSWAGWCWWAVSSLADGRLNLVDMRRVFFRARLAEVRELLTRLDASIVEWIDQPEGLE